MAPTLFCPQNVDFVIFMQFLAILPKMSPTSQPHWKSLYDNTIWDTSFFCAKGTGSWCFHYLQMKGEASQKLLQIEPKLIWPFDV